ncbi:hypothetical protein K2173_023581 [Erythroxylum novogranatense]|uniref:Uncharacterized protein n=1 Tax=Erythroxylum novogranatense TaxID=1862640 RepID=A0AAV8TP71_9ROSI|nr:hypothetical protein K2173_023581 [Erythroxylum novogranatense]
MDSMKMEHQNTCHLVAAPYPGRGHVNGLMNLCQILCSKNPHLLITFVVTEEWYSFINGDSSVVKPSNLRFSTIPNIIPSELVRGKDFPGFLEAVSTKVEAPFEHLLDGLELPINAILADTHLVWMARVGNRRNIPVASFWPMPTTTFSFFHHFHLLQQNGHFPADLSERGQEIVNYIPGLPSTRLADLPTVFDGIGRQVLRRPLESVLMVPRVQSLIFNSVYELESQVIDALRPNFPFPIYHVGPAIPYLELQQHALMDDHMDVPDYIKWLNSQPEGSVIYVSSMGSFLSVSSAQLEEIVAGLQNSGVKFLWVSRGETKWFKDWCSDKGLVVPWCDQLRVLRHPSVGGFWSHCGWNSTLEAVFAGVPILAAPIFFDQVPTAKTVEEDWKIGWRLWREAKREALITREEIARLVQSFMDAESIEVKEMRNRAKELGSICQAAIAKGGSSDTSLDSFIENISHAQTK